LQKILAKGSEELRFAEVWHLSFNLDKFRKKLCVEYTAQFWLRQSRTHRRGMMSLDSKGLKRSIVNKYLFLVVVCYVPRNPTSCKKKKYHMTCQIKK
jgi:hypothetical protein